MARKAQEEWITSKEAAKILTDNSGHIVSTNYVRRLAFLGKIVTRELDERTRLYRRSDFETRVVAQKKRL